MELVHNSAQYSTTYFTGQVRLRVVPNFSLGIVERAKRERA